MKAIYLYYTLAAILLAACGRTGQEETVHFDDEIFKAYCIEHFDKNGDHEISVSEAKEVKSISIITSDVASMKGIEHFTNLETLECCDNRLTQLDVTHLTKLKKLNCGDNDLTQLDVTNNKALEHLICCANKLTKLDVSQNKALTLLYCDKNDLTQLDVSRNTQLVHLECDYNYLTSLNLMNNTKLEVLTCYDNPNLKDIWMRHDQQLRILYTKNTKATIHRMRHSSKAPF